MRLYDTMSKKKEGDTMYKYNGKEIIKKLNSRGFTSYEIKKRGLMSQGTLQKLKNNGNVTLETINSICCMLRCDIGDIFEIEITNDDKLKYF